MHHLMNQNQVGLVPLVELMLVEQMENLHRRQPMDCHLPAGSWECSVVIEEAVAESQEPKLLPKPAGLLVLLMSQLDRMTFCHHNPQEPEE